MSQDNKRNFILHGSILAMAGIFVRIIGMVYRIPVLNIIGSEGNGIYVTAYNVYNIIPVSYTHLAIYNVCLIDLF